MIIPIFPLNGAIFFPDTNLPLNIFEKRYLEMIDFCMSNKRLLGMIQTKEDGKLYELGCLGKIVNFNETSDNRYIITLQGLNIFKVINEIESDYNFRMINSKTIQDESKFNNFKSEDKKILIEKYSEYIKIKNINLNIKDFENISIDQILKFIPMISPFSNLEKQMLVETLNLNDFFNKLLSILDLEIHNNNLQKSIN
tara:strand:- start:876 stop:1469 length:594 start_codon:yes stop_codon:yes gene_type:complete